MNHNKIKIQSISDFRKIIEENKTDIDENAKNMIEDALKNSDIEYRAYDIYDFIDYLEKKNLFKEELYKLFDVLTTVCNITIKRTEYEKVRIKAPDVSYLENEVLKAHKNILSVKNSDIENDIEKLDYEISRKCIYAKDIELLKKIILFNNPNVDEKYDYKKRQRTLFIKKPSVFTMDFIKFKLGSIEYHNFLNDSVIRIKRLILNIKKYIKESDSTSIEINQSSAIQDSVNVAKVNFSDKEFKALSGNDEVEGFIKAPDKNAQRFKSFRVNRLCEIGTGYDRFCDSEKKIFEKIDEQIEKKMIMDEGKIILKSRWEPCPSCYYVMQQFIEKHPNIKIKVLYLNDYGRGK